MLCAIPVLAQDAKPSLPSLTDTKVTLTWDDFRRLVEASMKEEKVPPPPPSAYSIDRIGYQGEVRKGFMVVKAQVTVTVLEPEQWVQIPLVGGCALTDVRGLKDALTVSGSSYQLLARGAGTRTFEIDFTVKGGDRPGENSLSFQSPEAAVSYMRVVASADVEKVEAPSLLGAVAEQGGKAVMGAAPQGSIAVTYHLPLPKEVAAVPGVQEVKQEPKVFVEERTLATVGEGVLRLRTTFAYNVLLAPVTTFRYRLPEGVEVLEAQGTDLQEGFKVLKEADGSRTLEVRATFEVKGAYAVTVTAEKDLGAEKKVTTDLLLLEPLGVERAQGVAGIEAEANAEVVPVAVEHMTAVDVTEVPQDVWDAASNPLLLGFRYLERPFRASLDITRHDDLGVMVAACDSAFVTTLVTDDGATLTRALFNLRNNRKQFLEVTIPEKAEVWSVFIRDRAVKPAKGKQGAVSSVLIPLPRSIERTQPGSSPLPNQEQAFPLEVVYFREASAVRRTGGTLPIEAPAIDVPVSQMGLSVYLPRRRSYHFLSGTLRPESESRADVLAGWLDFGGLGLMRDKAVSYESYRSMAPPAMAPGEGGAAPAPAAPAADDFSAKQVQEDQTFKEKVGKKAYAAASATGSLPVRITFPEEGVNLRFRKLLAIGDPANVRLLYVHAAVTTLLGIALRILGIFCGIALVRLAARRISTGSFLPGREPALLAGSFAAALVANLLLDVSPSLFTFWLFLTAFLAAIARVLLAAVRWLRSRGSRPAPPAAPPPPPPPPPPAEPAPSPAA